MNLHQGQLNEGAGFVVFSSVKLFHLSQENITASIVLFSLRCSQCLNLFRKFFSRGATTRFNQISRSPVTWARGQLHRARCDAMVMANHFQYPFSCYIVDVTQAGCGGELDQLSRAAVLARNALIPLWTTTLLAASGW